MSVSKPGLLIATTNEGKVAELRELLKECRLELSSLSELDDVPLIEETGLSFEENARLKATAYAVHAGAWTLADDSGLEVNSLDGRPGIMSARYGGDHLGYPDKIMMLLTEVESATIKDRSARFVCAMAVSSPDGTITHETMGICVGTIVPDLRGTNGFGYDPIFVPEGHNLTFGELDNSVKREISHRADALRQIIPFLRHINID